MNLRSHKILSERKKWLVAKERTKFALASRPCKMYSQVNSNPLAPTQRGASLCSTESANAQPATREMTPTNEDWRSRIVQETPEADEIKEGEHHF